MIIKESDVFVDKVPPTVFVTNGGCHWSQHQSHEGSRITTSHAGSAQEERFSSLYSSSRISIDRNRHPRADRITSLEDSKHQFQSSVGVRDCVGRAIQGGLGLDLASLRGADFITYECLNYDVVHLDQFFNGHLHGVSQEHPWAETLDLAGPTLEGPDFCGEAGQPSSALLLTPADQVARRKYALSECPDSLKGEQLLGVDSYG